MISWITTATSTEERDRRADVAVLPIGSFEQHGSILPLTTDTVVASLIARQICEDHNLFLLPPITISCSHEHAAFAGTVSISARTLHAVVDDIRGSLSASGIDRLVLVNGHGGNYFLSNVAQEANVTAIRVALFPLKSDWERAREEAGLETDQSLDMHAGELEVSLLLHGSPELVRSGYQEADNNTHPRPHLLMKGMAGYTESGVLGSPSLGTAAKGKLLLESLSRSFVKHLDVLTSNLR